MFVVMLVMQGRLLYRLVDFGCIVVVNERVISGNLNETIGIVGSVGMSDESIGIVVSVSISDESSGIGRSVNNDGSANNSDGLTTVVNEIN